MGNALARLTGLRTPDPVVALMGETMANEVNDMFRKMNRFPNMIAGHCPGCRQFRAGQESMLMDIPMRDAKSALTLYIFDMLSGNSDRVIRNPNCTVDSTGLIVYDFEQCFSLDEREMFDPLRPAWLVSNHGLGRTHMFHSKLVGLPDVETEVKRILGKLSTRTLRTIESELPDAWRPEASRIIGHVKMIRDHADDFIKDIVESLK